MDYKTTMENQIKELEKLQEENLNSEHIIDSDKVDNAVKIAEQICMMCVNAIKVM
jgi:hypothetical protein